MPTTSLITVSPAAPPRPRTRRSSDAGHPKLSPRQRRALTVAFGVAVVAVLAIALHASGGLGLYTSVTKDEIVKPPNWAQLDGTSKNIKGQILAYVGLFLGPLLVFAGACVIVGARLGNELMGKIAGGLVFLVAVAPAILA